MKANKCKHLVSAMPNTSDPTQMTLSPMFDAADDDTIAISNVSRRQNDLLPQVYASTTTLVPQLLNTVTIARDHAIADTGATSIFIMDGIDVVNKRVATSPLTINLPDGKQVKSSHICDITIPGLPTILMGHIVPSLTVALLIGIRPLCKAGCKVIFDDKKCEVVFDNKVILRGHKDPSTDLWTLPINKKVWTAPGPNVLP